MGTRRDRLAGVTVALGLAAAATTFLPWARSGQRWRTSYEVVEVADRAGVLPDGLAGAAPLWYLVPALAGAVVLAAALARHLLLGGLAVTLGALVGIGSLAVGRSPLDTAWAVVAALVLGAATAANGAAVVVTARKEAAA